MRDFDVAFTMIEYGGSFVRKLGAAALVAEIDQARGERNLSSAVRVWLLKQAAAQ